MNTTQNRPVTTPRNEQQNLTVQIHQIRQLLTSGTELEEALAKLEQLVPVVSAYVASESLANQNLDVVERNPAEERVSEIRSKVRELNALLDSGSRLLQDGMETEGVSIRAAALGVYLVSTLTETADALARRPAALAVLNES